MVPLSRIESLKTKLQYLAGAVLFIGLLGFVDYYIGWKRLLAPWATLSMGTLFIAVGLTFVSYWLRAVRLFDYFRADMQGGFTVCFKLMLQHNLLNNLLPMRTGELSFPLLMSRYFKVPANRSVPALLWFRVLDLHTLAALALTTAGSHWLGPRFALIVTVVWMILPWWLFKAGRWLRNKTAVRVEDRLHARLTRLLDSLPQGTGEFVRAWVWTALNWITKLAVFAWVMLQFVDVDAYLAWLGVIAGDLTSVLPVHGIAGAGTYEAGVAAVLLPFGVPTEEALQAAVNVHLFILGSTLIGGLLSLLIPSGFKH